MAQESDEESDGLSRRTILLGLGGITVALFFFVRDDEEFFGGEGEIQARFEEYLSAIEAGDREAYMATIHPDAPIRETARAEFEDRLGSEDVTVTATFGTVDRIGDQADVDIVFELRGPDIENVLLSRVFEFRLHEEVWHVYDWETIDEEPIGDDAAGSNG